MEESEPVIVDLPLRGEWVLPNTPGDRVPSHGTDALGQRYAYDLFRTVEGSGTRFHSSSRLKYFSVGVGLDDCLCYGEPIHSPVDGKVVAARDGIAEHGRLHPLVDLLRVLRNSISVSLKAMLVPVERIDLHRYIGNHVIIEFDGIYAFLAHIRPGTIRVKAGQTVRKGDLIGQVGHSGNSTAPHLHFHLMDSPDLLKASGIPCAFSGYEVLTNEGWVAVENGIPGSAVRIRGV